MKNLTRCEKKNVVDDALRIKFSNYVSSPELLRSSWM